MSILLTVVAVLVAQITITKARSIDIDPHEIQERSLFDFEEFLTPVFRDASNIKGKHGRKKPVVKIVSLDDLEKIAKNNAHREHASATIRTANDETPFAIIISSNSDPAHEIENDVEDLTHYSSHDEADLKTQPHKNSDEVKLETESSKEGDGKELSDSKDKSQFRIFDRTEDESENSDDSHYISDSEETITGRIVPGKLEESFPNEEQQIIQPKNADDSNFERYNNINFNKSPEATKNEYTTQRIDVEIDTPHLLDDDERFDTVLEPYDESIQYNGVLFEDSENLKENSHINEIRGRTVLNADRKEVNEDFTREGSADKSENGKTFVYGTIDENGEDFSLKTGDVKKVKYLTKDFNLNVDQKNLIKRKCERDNDKDVTNKSYHLLITFN